VKLNDTCPLALTVVGPATCDDEAALAPGAMYFNTHTEPAGASA